MTKSTVFLFWVVMVTAADAAAAAATTDKGEHRTTRLQSFAEKRL